MEMGDVACERGLGWAWEVRKFVEFAAHAGCPPPSSRLASISAGSRLGPRPSQSFRA